MHSTSFERKVVVAIESHISSSSAASPAPTAFLKAGDVVTLGIEGLGEQRQKVVRGK